MDMLLIVLGVKPQANNIQRSDLIEGERVHVIGRLVIFLAFEALLSLSSFSYHHSPLLANVPTSLFRCFRKITMSVED